MADLGCLLYEAEKTCRIRVLQNEPMSAHTTFRIGGPADYFVSPETRGDFLTLMRLLHKEDVRPFVLGNGSNLLVSDEGICGVVVSTEPALCFASCDGRKLNAGAGILLSKLAQIAKDQKLSGLEFAQGIPGTLGGAVFMNAGAYGGAMSGVVAQTTYLEGEEEKQLSREEHLFSYRSSFFSEHPEAIILESTLLLEEGDTADIAGKMNDFAQRRREKQPLSLPSAGSAFKRPEGYFAGKLIEDAGLRGLSVGGAQVSEKHCGFIVNRGGASCADVRRLIEIIQDTVLHRFGVTLQCEIRMVGGR